MLTRLDRKKIVRQMAEQMRDGDRMGGRGYGAILNAIVDDLEKAEAKLRKSKGK